LALAAGLCVAAWLPGCSGSGGAEDGGPDPDADGADGADEVTPPLQIVFGQPVLVDDEEAGVQLDLAATPAGDFAVAYFRRVAEMSECTTPILGGPPVPVHQDMVRYAWRDGDSWSREDVATIETTSLYGIELIFALGGARVAYLGGVEGLQVCGGSDLIVAARSGAGAWSESAAVSMSNEAPEGAYCPKGQGMCDFGDVVGLWPAMAVAPDGALAIAYRDIHNGYEKESNDSADLEWASTSGGGWTHEWMDLGRGAGLYNALAYDAAGQPAVVSYNGKYGVITFARRDPAAALPFAAFVTCTSQADCPEGLTCVLSSGYCFQAIHRPEGSLPERSLAFAVAPDGRFLVAFFDPDEKNLMLAHSTDGYAWTKGRIDTNGATGLSPSLVIDPATGRPGVAYYRCSDHDPNQLVCDPGQDGVRFSHFVGVYPDELTQQNKWRRVAVSSDPDATDGDAVSAAVLPDGRVGVAYSYAWVDPVDGESHSAVMFKLGEWQ